MRALYVYENVSFKRGQDPKKSMDIGRLSRGPELFTDFYEYVNKKKPYGLDIAGLNSGHYWNNKKEKLEVALSIDIYGKKVTENFTKLLKEFNLDLFIVLPGREVFGNQFHRRRNYTVKEEFIDDFLSRPLNLIDLNP